MTGVPPIPVVPPARPTADPPRTAARARSPFSSAFAGALGAALAYAIYRALVDARQVLILILLAAFLAVGLSPAVDWLVTRRMRRGAAVATASLASVLFFAGFIASLVPPLVTQSQQLIKNAPRYSKQLSDTSTTLGRIDARLHVTKLLHQQSAKGGPGVPSQALGGVLGVGRVAVSVLLSALTVTVLTVYLLASLPGIKHTVYRLAPRSRRARVSLIGDEILSRIGGYVLGKLATSVVAGVLHLIVLEILGVPYAVALALLTAVVDLVPLVGSYIAMVVIALAALLVSIPVVIATIVFHILYRLFEDYLLTPVVMRRTVEISPTLTIVSVLLGGVLLGLVGALIAIPVAAAVQLVFEEVAVPRLDQA